VNDRSDDLSTADLAGQRPADSARADDRPDRGTGYDDAGYDQDSAVAPGGTADRPSDEDRLAGDRMPGGVVHDRLSDDRTAGGLTAGDDRGAMGGPGVARVDAGDAPVDTMAAPAGAAPTTGPAGTAAGTGGSGPLLPAAASESFRARWTDVQTGFVDAPRQAVEQADGLVAELMQHLAKTFADERGRLEGQWDRGDDVQTDELRTAFQRYRSFFERLLST
jgi:hypothetical protein